MILHVGRGNDAAYLAAQKLICSLFKAMVNGIILRIIWSRLHRASHHGPEMAASASQNASKRAIFVWQLKVGIQSLK